MYGGNLGGDVVWLVGRGQRYDDSPHRDFHKQLGLKLQLDPTDSWKPTRKDDYPALFAKRAEEETQAALEAIREARDEAVEHPNTVVEIELPRLDSSVGEVHWEEHVAGVIADDLHYRYFVVSRVYEGTHEYLAEELALTYADEAFEGVDVWGPIGAQEIMLEGLDGLNDAEFYCYAGDVSGQP